MAKESLEHISVLMDGEFSRETGMFLARRLSSEEAMCEKWERYHLIRDCIRQPGGKQVVSGLCEKFNASLDAEDTSVEPFGNTHRWLKPVAGLAIAASVALMAIVVTAPPAGTIPGNSADATLASPANPPFVSPNTLSLTPAIAPVSQAVSYASAQQANTSRLNAYLLRHNQTARTAGRQGFVSFVPIVATQPPVQSKSPGGEPEDRIANNKKDPTQEAATDQ